MTSACVHIHEAKKRRQFSKYDALLSHIVFPSDTERHCKKNAVNICDDCVDQERVTEMVRNGEHGRAGARVLMSCCLECPTFCCLQHLLPHLRDSKHSFALSLETGYIYCLKCGDFVYDRLLEGIRLDAYNKYRRRFGLSFVASWNPTDEDLGKLAKSLPVSTATSVRGIVNMGNTCFMNCILQCLLHSPSLRDFFLSHQHGCSPSATPPHSCIMCEMQSTFQFFYNGVCRSSFVPSSMLHLLWTRSHLAGYRQHDAHEFFITAIEMLHKDSRTSFSYQTVSPDCKCIIDQLFTGKFQSDLKCSVCGNVSTKLDPFWDVSLNLSPATRDLTLEKCLEGYVSSEILDSAFPCTSCDGRCPHKQLSFQQTPVISVFHLKRFEHDTHLRKKITTRVTFPEKLDMTPYTSDYRNWPDRFDTSRDSQSVINRRSNHYSLFAVVQHEGSLDSGHYTAFVRAGSNWFLCDDEKIRQVPVEKVLTAEAYILFYHVTHIKFR